MEPPSTAVNYGYIADEIVQKREHYFRGCAKVRLEHLDFEEGDIPGTRPEDSKNILRLQNIFKTQGCHKLDPNHYVAVRISEEKLRKSVSVSKTSQESLMRTIDPPELQFDEGTKLMCLFGRHRIKAAKAHHEDWWIVELYLDSIPSAAQLQLREESSNEKNFKDGFIYRTLRYYQLKADMVEERNWWVKYSEEKRKHVRRLQLKRSLLRAYDRLLPYIGLWDALNATHFKDILALRCPEVAVCYLQRMRDQWSSLLSDDTASLLDSPSVRILEGLMPQYSKKDQEVITNKMGSNELFPLVSDHSRRNILTELLLKTEGRFLSLRTLAQDTIFLTPAASALRALTPKNYRGGILKELTLQFKATSIIQKSERDYTPASFSEPKRVALLQLWLSAIRHFTKPRVESSEQWSMPLPKGYRLGLLASIARQLGFDSPHIRSLSQQHDTAKMSQMWLGDLCQEELVRVDSNDYQKFVEGCQTFFKGVSRKTLVPDEPDLTTRYDADSAKRRFNSPFASEFRQDRPLLYLPHLYCEIEQESWPTSFAVTREIFLSFFGPLPAFNSGSPGIEAESEEDIVPLEQHPSSQPPSPARRMEFDVHALPAPGFEDESSANYEVKTALIRRGPDDIIEKWAKSSREVIVLYLFEDSEYIKFPPQGSIGLRSTLKDLARTHYFMPWTGTDIRLAEDAYEDALEYKLLLVGKKDHPWQTYNNSKPGEIRPNDFIDYIRHYTPVTGKRSAEGERLAKRVQGGVGEEEDEDL